jgi:hypothetical protein
VIITYTPNPDTDGDGVNDSVDNCPNAANPDQADLDDDGLGDACDPDKDGDRHPNGSDNCPSDANPSQADNDGDGIGTACDSVELPTSKEQCKDGGWTLFYDGTSRFKNEGDCVSFVATGSKNPPAG